MSIIPVTGIAEPFSSLSHLAGAAVFACLTPALLWRGWGEWGRVVTLGLFAASAIWLLTMSGVYHGVTPGGTPRVIFQRLDHAAIFVLIAATFTPVHWILFRGWQRWGVLASIWGIGLGALTVKSIFFHSVPEWASLGLYLGMGWLGLGSGVLLARRHGFRFVEPIVWGGIAYSLGAMCEYLKWPAPIPGAVEYHEVFHVAVLIGLALHWAFIYSIADGHRSVDEPGVQRT